MLQQTTVAAVLAYYTRFLERFPDLPALAQAREEDVLRAWAGLGYYSRARNLHKAARHILLEHNGIFPNTFDAILNLPGVGRYTAGAIISIAFNKSYPVLDGNVMRVFSRLYAYRTNIKEPATIKKMWALADQLVPRKNPGDWNQALMELGATICIPQTPRCGVCPVALWCQARKQGISDALPVMPRRRTLIQLTWTCLWIESNGRVLLWKRSKNEKFLQDQWALPEARHLKIKPGSAVRTIRHSITHHCITVKLCTAQSPKHTPTQAAWVARRDVHNQLVSSLWFKCLKEV